MKGIKYLLALGTCLIVCQTALSQNWSLTGNSGITPSTDFIGTTDSKTLRFRTNNIQRATIDSLGNITLGGVYPNAPAQLVINYHGDQYDGRGIRLVNNVSGSIVRLHSFNSGLYLTTDNGSPTGMILGSRFNPDDNSEFRAAYNRWEIRTGTFSVNQDWTGYGQFEMTIGAADRKGMIIKAASSQTAHLQEWQNSSGSALAILSSSGRMGIGTTNVADTNYRLFVEKGIHTRKVKVDQSTWADYVFHHTYKLLPLSEVEKFIRLYNHLPEVPSAKEVEENGIDLGDNQVTLLKKIEELTLYLIEQHKKLEEQNKKMEQMQKEMEVLKKQQLAIKN